MNREMSSTPSTSILGSSAPEQIRKHKDFVKELQRTQKDRVCTGMVLGVKVTTAPART